MLLLVFFLFLGLLTGALFQVNTLFLFMLFLAIEGACGRIAGLSIGFSDWVCAGIALQLGYVGGVFMRSLLERFTARVFHRSRESLKDSNSLI